MEYKFAYKNEEAPEEILQPITPEERGIWEEIQGADKPIQNILKRLNRIMQTKFPNTDIITIDSCSGHVKQDGSIAYKAVLPEFKENKRPKNPSLTFSAPREKVSEVENNEIVQFLEDVLLKSVNKTNGFFKKEVVLFEKVHSREGTIYGDENTEPKDVRTFSCRVSLLENERAFDVLQEFWKNFRDLLSEYDSIKMNESYDKEDYYPDEPADGLVWPE
jgi:hypothetical protein